jgi:hypothetical protein
MGFSTYFKLGKSTYFVEFEIPLKDGPRRGRELPNFMDTSINPSAGRVVWKTVRR